MHPREMRLLVARLDVHQREVHDARSTIIGSVGSTISAVQTISSDAERVDRMADAREQAVGDRATSCAR